MLFFRDSGCAGNLRAAGQIDPVAHALRLTAVILSLGRGRATFRLPKL